MLRNEQGEGAAVAVAVILDFEGATLSQYGQVIEKMGLTPGGETPQALFHWVAETDTGVRVVDVWETRERFQQFADEQIGPHTEEVGMANPPTIAFHEVHSYLTAG